MVSSIESHFDDGITFDFSIDRYSSPSDRNVIFIFTVVKRERQRERKREREREREGEGIKESRNYINRTIYQTNNMYATRRIKRF